MNNGEIPFTMLVELYDQLKKVSESVLRFYTEGYSTSRRGQSPAWLRRSLDFNLSGIKKGSTILQVKAPTLVDSMGSVQLGLHNELGLDNIQNNTAISLAMTAFETAFTDSSKTEFWDKHLLKSLYGFHKFVSKPRTAIEFGLPSEGRKVQIVRKHLNKIKLLEEKTPNSIKTYLSGTLDMMKYSDSQLEIITNTGRVRAFLGENISIDKIKPFFGEDITVSGVANFSPAKKIASFEIAGIQDRNSPASYFYNTPQPIQEKLHFSDLVSEQDYKGTSKSKIHNIIDELDVQEDLDSLLNMLKG